MSQKFYSEVTLETLNNATTDTDRFLVGDSGTIKYRTGSQLLSDLGVSGLYVPYTGATGNVDLGTHTLSSYNLIVNHTSGSGVAASITKGGSGEALTINKSSGSGNAMSVIGGLTSLVDLTLSSIPNATIDTDRFIVSDGGAIKYRTGAQVLSDIGGQPALTNPITGTGTTNYVSKFTEATSLGDSQIFDTGTNVGIGTTNPNYQTVGRLVVDINGSSQSLLGFSIGTNPSAYIASTSTLTELASVSNPLLFTVGSERMRITSSGNVGIGVSDPISKLEVLSDFKVRNPSNSFVRFNFGWTNSNQTAYLDTYNFSTGARPDLSLQPDGGNVGIGTTTPGTKLQINVAPTGAQDDGMRVTDGTRIIQTNIVGDTYNYRSVGPNETMLYSTGNPLNIVSDGQPIKFTAGTSERMRIASNGNVGIGTTSPATQLHLNGSAELRFTNPTNTSGFDIGLLGGGSDANTYIYQRANSSMVFGTNNTERMRITASGNVGIGTTSPYQSKVHIFKSESGSNPIPVLRIGNQGNGYISRIVLTDETTNDANISYIGSLQSLGFGVGASLSQMIINSSGNVGIGTSSPGYKLDVSGNGRFSSDLLTTGRFGAGSTNVNSRIFASAFSGELSAAIFTTFNSAQSGQEAARFSTSDLVTGAVRIYPRVGLANYNGITVSDSAIIVNMPTKPLLVGVQDGSAVQFTETDIRIGTNNSERMRITSAGNVGIGTTSPQAKLHSNSDILTGYFQNGTDGIYDALKITNNTASNNLSGNSARIQFYNNANNSTNLLGASIRSVNVDYGWASDLILSSVQNNGYASQTVNDAIYIKSSGNVGIGLTNPSSSAILHLRSTTQGFLPPVMKTGERNGISSPAIGLMIFNKDDDAVQVYTGEGWRTLAWA